jgi:hypothetical protein
MHYNKQILQSDNNVKADLKIVKKETETFYRRNDPINKDKR